MLLKNSEKFKTFLKFAKWLWTVAVVSAVGYYVVTRWDKIGDYFQQIPILNFLLSLGLLILAKLMLVYVSKASVEKEGEQFHYQDAFTIVSFSHLAKYIPGGIWHFVGRLSAYSEKGFGTKKSSRALIHENVWLLSGALITGVSAGALSSNGQILLNHIGMKFPAPVLAVLIMLVWFGGLFAYEKLFPSSGTVQYFGLILGLVLTWFSLGLSFGIILPEFSLNSNFFFYISIYSLSWLVGYFAIFAPGGIGIREAVLFWMLNGIVSPEMAIIYSTAHRFIFIIVEILLGGISVAINVTKRKVDR